MTSQSTRKFVVGAAHDAAERDADRTADQLMSAGSAGGGSPAGAATAISVPLADTRIRRAPQQPASDDRELNDDVANRIRAATGRGEQLAEPLRRSMGDALGTDLDSVRVHRSPEAASLSTALSAEAFTTGNDIFFGAGRYRPEHSDGQRLIAHEVAHVVQGGSPVRRASDDGIIRRKLSGSSAAVVEMAGDASLKSKGKALVSKAKGAAKFDTTGSGSGKYSQILWELKAYEKKEATAFGKNRVGLDAKKQADMLKRLHLLRTLCEAWLREHRDEEISNPDSGASIDEIQAVFQNDYTDLSDPQRALRDGVAEQFPGFQEANFEAQTHMASTYQRSEQTPNAGRYRAIKMLLPRIRHEAHVVSQGNFYQDEMYSDETRDAGASQDNWTGGAVNRLDRVGHADRAGATKDGVFIEDKSWMVNNTVGNKAGISNVDPNAGARSVAMYQLAKLLDLGVDVIAKTDFATHTSATDQRDQSLDEPTSRMGVRMEMATGTEAAEVDTEITAAEATAKGGDTISLEDPTLQRSLNALQLIDAIAGQLDRHWRNYYISTDGNGQVTGVIGIDLDMAFAADHTTVTAATDHIDDPLKGAHFVGMPQLVDSDFAARILLVQEDAVRTLLSRYLDAAEVDSTMTRFGLVQGACRQILQAMDQNRLVNPDAWGAATATQQATDSSTSYVGKMAAGTVKHEFRDPVTGPAYTTIRPNTERKLMDAVLDRFGDLIAAHSVTIPQARTLTDAILATYSQVAEDARQVWLSRLGTTPIGLWNNGVQNLDERIDAAAIAPFAAF